MIYMLMVFLVGLFLSAFFSGSETGFYRATRVRVALDGLSGDLVSRVLLWLTNNPTLFVATALVGNNVANYLTSLAIVMASQRLFGNGPSVADLIAPVIMAPIVFIYGELLPKNLYFHAPNRLLRRGGLLFVVFGVLCAPIVALLWLMGRLLELVIGQSPEGVRLRLARNELQQVFAESEAIGLLCPIQQQLAQAVFAVANEPVARHCIPMSRMTTITEKTTREEALDRARRRQSHVILIMSGRPARPTAYMRTADLELDSGDWQQKVRPLSKLRHTETHIGALIRLHSRQELMAEVTNARGNTLGVVTKTRLLDPLLGDS